MECHGDNTALVDTSKPNKHRKRDPEDSAEKYMPPRKAIKSLGHVLENIPFLYEWQQCPHNFINKKNIVEKLIGYKMLYGEEIAYEQLGYYQDHADPMTFRDCVYDPATVKKEPPSEE
ncbi:unnamed protein product [Heligmosomoides polygyrus]|uniref:MAGE domain-containing protein n=1 Tax=Heligmosomoides polygyrus TaxID=6339 RepID=A0A183G9R5_HELPZ|nr:unnamed protein product [Heligmosomoides polygyrus]